MIKLMYEIQKNPASLTYELKEFIKNYKSEIFSKCVFYYPPSYHKQSYLFNLRS